MLRVGRDEDVSAHIDAGTGAFFEGDDRQPIQKVIQNLLALLSCLFRDPVTYLSRRREDAAVIADLCQAAETADGSSRAERHEIAVVCFGRKSGRTQRVEAYVLIKVERKAIGTHGTMEGDKHLSLLCIADALHGPNQASALGHEKLLVVV